MLCTLYKAKREFVSEEHNIISFRKEMTEPKKPEANSTNIGQLP